MSIEINKAIKALCDEMPISQQEASTLITKLLLSGEFRLTEDMKKLERANHGST